MAVLVGNDRLTPNTLDPNAFFPRLSAHNSDSRSPVSDYKKAVRMTINLYILWSVKMSSDNYRYKWF